MTMVDACAVMLLAFAAGPTGGCGSSLSNPAEVTNGAPQVGVELDSLEPDSGPVGTTVVLRGKGFGETGNTVRFGQGYIRDLKVSEGGTALTFTIPDGVDLCAPGMTPCAGGFARVAPGTNDVSVITRAGESTRLVFTVSAP